MKTIGQRINQVMLEVKTVLKDGRISMGGNSYDVVTHDMVTSILHEPMARAGIYTELKTTDFEISSREYVDQYNKPKREYMAKCMLLVSFYNCDDKADYFTVSVPSYAFDQGDKAVGKMLSMGQKYALLKTFMLESVDHEEERADAKVEQKPLAARKIQSPPLIMSIQNLLTEQTKEMNAQQKTDYMKSKLKIDKFSDLSKLTESELLKKYNLLK